MDRPRVIAIAVLATVAATAAAGGGPAVPAYDRDVAPILRTWCAGCHNDADREGSWSVEQFATLRRGGAEGIDPVVPGDADASLMMRRMASTDGDHMPPAEAPQPPAADVAVLRAWITAGAPGPTADVSILRTLHVPAIPPFHGPRPVTALAVGPDASIAVATGRVVRVYPRADVGATAATPPRLEVTDLPGEATAIHFGGDGRRLVIATGLAGLTGEAQLRDAATGGLIRAFGGASGGASGGEPAGSGSAAVRHRDLLYDAELSPDGSLLATVGYDRILAVWRVADGSLVWSNTVHNGAIFDVAWHPSGRLLATASADETVKLWTAEAGGRLDTLGQPQGDVTSVAFTPDGRHVIAAGRDRRIHLWSLRSLDTPGINPLLHARFAHDAAIVAIAVSSDGRRLLSSAEDGSLSEWTLPDLVLAGLRQFDATGRRPDVAAAVAAGADGFLVGRMDGRVEVFESAVVAAPDRGPEPLPAETAPPAVAAAPSTGDTADTVTEVEPNDDAPAAMSVSVPASIRGVIGRAGDADCFRFAARAGVPVLLEIDAARSMSRLDSKIEVLHADGRPVERVVLQATRDSWFTFRGKDSSQADDFRVHNWAEMELDEYLYAGGEVVKLWHYPRGPDSGFIVYPGFGPRHGFFGTTPVTHALGAPAWIVEPLPPGATPAPNGLPVFRLVWENDDDPTRRLGADSQLVFEPPADGDYVVRVTDVRGFGGTADDAGAFHYTLSIRPPRPAFRVAIDGRNPAVSPGSGRELGFTIERLEGFAGPVRIDVTGLPAGFTFHGPLEIAAGQRRAFGVLSAAADAPPPAAAAEQVVRVTATGLVGSAEVVEELGDLGTITLADPPKVTIAIVDPEAEPVADTDGLVLSIRPGQTIRALVRAVRHDFDGRIELGSNADVGRNLPHGAYVDNVGLNGLLIVEDQTEREFFLTAAPLTKPGRRRFHLKAAPDGGQTSLPVWLDVAAPPDLPAP